MPIFVKNGSRGQSQMGIGQALFPHTPGKAQTSFGREWGEVGNQRKSRNAPDSPLTSFACSGGGVWVRETQGTVGPQGDTRDDGAGAEVAH